MGDGGSLFIGSLMAGCSLVPWFGGEKSNPFWPMALAVALIVPLGEASFVATLRWMAGRTGDARRDRSHIPPAGLDWVF